MVEIGDPVDELPMIFASHWSEVWKAVIAAEGRWVPVKCGSVLELKQVQRAARGWCRYNRSHTDHNFTTRSDPQALILYISNLAAIKA